MEIEQYLKEMPYTHFSNYGNKTMLKTEWVKYKPENKQKLINACPKGSKLEVKADGKIEFRIMCILVNKKLAV